MDKLLTAFNRYLDNSYVQEWAQLCREYGTLRTYKKGEEFITIGQNARYIGLIKSGSAKYVVYTPGGEERVIGLETAGGYVASFPYSLREQPSIWSVVINADSEIYCLSVRQIIALCRCSGTLERTVMQSLEAVFYNLYDRYIDLYALTPKERYEQLLKKCPRLFEIFQLKDIASYLNITRQHLGRLRSEKSTPNWGGADSVEPQPFTWL